ncbi:hypothetical protein, partial [Listeria monocytogenes]|uniref:hypothetical protein n=1 Tax=Listeria monocytogenes TaxID=1639 RepID=UPI003F6665FC
MGITVAYATHDVGPDARQDSEQIAALEGGRRYAAPKLQQQRGETAIAPDYIDLIRCFGGLMTP